jgi:hypothetical protein
MFTRSEATKRTREDILRGPLAQLVVQAALRSLRTDHDSLTPADDGTQPPPEVVQDSGKSGADALNHKKARTRIDVGIGSRLNAKANRNQQGTRDKKAHYS